MSVWQVCSRNSLLEKAGVALRKARRRRYEGRFFSPRLVTVKCGDFELAAPASHLLVDLHPPQMLRRDPDAPVPVRLAAKYPAGTLVDVGAISATPLLLGRAVPQRDHPGQRSDRRGTETTGKLNYRGGTASFHEGRGFAGNSSNHRAALIVKQTTRRGVASRGCHGMPCTPAERRQGAAGSVSSSRHYEVL